MLKHISRDSNNREVTPRTREILSKKQWFGNGPPQWRVGKAQRPAQTADEAYDERLQHVRRLHRHAPHNLAVQALANRLDSCAPHQRCMSAACPECGRATTRWFVA